MSDKYKMMGSIINALDLDLQGYNFEHFIPRTRFENIFNLRLLSSPLYKELCQLKKDDSLTTFEFIIDDKNWLKIEKHFSVQGRNNFNISDDTLNLFYNFLTSSVFSLDFKNALCERMAEYKAQNKIIYNEKINESEADLFFNFFGNDFTVSAEYNDYFHPIDVDKKMDFIINKNSESNDFTLEMKLHYQGLGLDKSDNKLYKKYKNTFKSKSFSLPVTKNNLNNFFDLFFDDINKTNITDFDIFRYVKEKSGIMDVSDFLLNKNYTSEYIKNNLIRPELKGSSRLLYDFNFTYPLCLAHDINKAVENCFNVRSGLSHLHVMFLNEHYFINIKDFKLNLSSSDDDNLFECDIRNTPDLKSLICEYIRCDYLNKFAHLFPFLENNLKDVTKLLNNIFSDTNVSISCPDFLNFSLENIVNRTIPVYLSSGSDNFELLVEINDIKKISEKEELKAFKERVLINSALGSDEMIIKENKKRL